jgi:hypothetical protein
VKSIPWIDIVAELRFRWNQAGPLHQRMVDVRDRYNGSAVDYVLPMGSNSMDEEFDALTPPLIAEAIDFLASRANEVTPGILCPALKAGKEEGVRSREYALRRRQALSETWEQSRMKLVMGRAYRHLGAYASFALAVVPDLELGMPRVKCFDPLSTFPDPQANEDYADAQNVGFITGMSAETLVSRFPQARELVTQRNNASAANQMWDVALWCDKKEWVMGVMGPRQDEHGRHTSGGQGWQTSVMELWREEHHLSRVPFITPRRVTLDVITSQLVNLVDQTDLAARLMRLQIAAAEKSIFPDRYVIGKSSTGMSLNDGANKWLDGRDGEVNRLLDVDAIGNLPGSPDPAAERVADRLERNFRAGSGLVPQAGGETYGALRTGRGIDALTGMAVDPRTREMQDVAQAYLPQLNESILEVYETNPAFKSKTYYLYSGAPGDYVRNEFIPSKHVEGVYDNKVLYSITGAGLNETNIIVTGMVGAELISRRSGREMHPGVKDAQLEEARITEEKLEAAMMLGIEQQLIQGGMPPIMAALIEKYQSENPSIDIFEAVRRADDDMRELRQREAEDQAQAAAAQPPAPPGAPPGMGAPPAPGGSIGPPGQLSNVRELNNAMRGANQNVAAG